MRRVELLYKVSGADHTEFCPLVFIVHPGSDTICRLPLPDEKIMSETGSNESDRFANLSLDNPEIVDV